MENTRQAKSSSGSRIAFGILVILVSLFCFLCNVHAFGGVGRMVYGFLVGFFGLAAYAYSVVGILIGFAITFGIKPKMHPARAFFLIGMFLIAVLALQIYSSSSHIIEADYKEYLMRCYDNTNTAGGMLFGIVAFPLMRLITTVGSLVVVCAVFFILLFFQILPLIEKDKVYDAVPKRERDRQITRSYREKVKSGEGPTSLDEVTYPHISDLSKGSKGIHRVNVAYEPQRVSRRAMGADGYTPLDDFTSTKTYKEMAELPKEEDKYSQRNLARELLFGQDVNTDTYNRYSTISNPGTAFTSIGNYSQPQRMDEMKAKLGIDSTGTTIREDFNSRYSNENVATTSVRDIVFGQSQTPKAEEVIPEVVAKEEKKDPIPMNSENKIDFTQLKNEQTRLFGTMFTEQKKEEGPKEVVKPTKVQTYDNILPKEESVDNSKVNVGMQGALNEAMNQDPYKAEPVQEPKKDIESVAYEVPNSYNPIKTETKNINDLDRSGYVPQDMSAKIPRSFQGADEMNAFAKGYEMGKASLEPEKKEMTLEEIKRMENTIPLPVQQEISSNKIMSRAEIQAATDIVNTSPKDKEQAEIDARIANIKAAIKDKPKVGQYEKQALEREGISTEKPKKKKDNLESLVKQADKLDTTKERTYQLSMDQAIEEAEYEEKKKNIRPYVFPPLDLLNPPAPEIAAVDDFDAKKQAIKDAFEFFGIQCEPGEHLVGPTFTLYKAAVMMPRGKQMSSIFSYEQDIAMKMRVQSVRITMLPLEGLVGIEVPNKNRRNVNFIEMVSSKEFQSAKDPVTIALGQDIFGKNTCIPVNKLPHAIVAGTTGSGKSCAIHSIIVGLLYKATPEDVRLILIDPKHVEFTAYEGIPHLLMDEVVTDVEKAIRALSWTIQEMEKRMATFSQTRVRDIEEYNANVAKHGGKKMPRIIIIVDEFADLIAVGKKAIEDQVNRIARLARFCGMHLILATQRPSVDVLSGTIKNNLPTRIALKVSSFADSKTVLDEQGAEKLLGWGDMIFKTQADENRMQGAYIDNSEIKRVVDFVKANNDVDFDENVKNAIFTEPVQEDSSSSNGGGKKGGGDDEISEDLINSLKLGLELRENGNKPISISLLQRKLRFGFAKAGRMVDTMDDMGYLSPDPSKKDMKYVNISREELNELMAQAGMEVDNDYPVGEEDGE